MTFNVKAESLRLKNEKKLISKKRFKPSKLDKHKPATLNYPAYSLAADYVMVFEALTGRLDHSHFSAPKKS